jgi:hypothetical protein
VRGEKVRAGAGIVVNVDEDEAVLRKQIVKRNDEPGLSTRDTLANAAGLLAAGEVKQHPPRNRRVETGV